MLLRTQSKLPASDLFKARCVALLFDFGANGGVQGVGRGLTAYLMKSHPPINQRCPKSLRFGNFSCLSRLFAILLPRNNEYRIATIFFLHGFL